MVGPNFSTNRDPEFPFLMLQEIYDQPRSVRNTIEQHFDATAGVVHLDRFPFTADQVTAFTKITIVASGASRHAGLCGRSMIEELAGIPVEVEHSSEYGYRRPLKDTHSLFVAITQSGETADTIAAQRIALNNGIKTLSISNVKESTIAREAESNFFTGAGAEVAVPATKSFTTQLTALYIFALLLSTMRGALSRERMLARVLALSQVPSLLSGLIGKFDLQAKVIARRYYRDKRFIYVGRGIHYPIALEGALKLKEISYVHAEGYPTGELRHGPQALIDHTVPIVAIVTRDPMDRASMLRYEKSRSVLNEVRGHSARQILVASEDDCEIKETPGSDLFLLPSIEELLLPLLEIVPLQLLAYHIAVLNGFNVDRPRNLVKAVTAD